MNSPRVIDCPDCAGMQCPWCSVSLAQVARNGDRCMNTMPPGPKCKKAKIASATIAACETCKGSGKVNLIVKYEAA